jgi:NADP-reducing hydrogenase subunit HndB
MSVKIGSPEDLNRLRDQVRAEVDMRGAAKETRITVHMGTCGIAAGAREILSELSARLLEAGVDTVTLRQSGCIGLCDQEPMLTYSDSDGRDYLYVRLSREKAREIVTRHVIGNTPVRSYILEE